MIKKIICPSDFSNASNNALEHSANLAQVFHAELLLLNIEKVHHVLAGVSPVMGAEARLNAHNSGDKLKQTTEEVRQDFSIEVNYEVDMTAHSLSGAIASHATKDSLIVMGTNGAEGLRQFLFGTNTYNVIRKAQCPVLLIPENYPFKKYETITFILVYALNDAVVLSSFYEFAKIFNAKITFVFVGNRNPYREQDFFQGIPEEARTHYLEEENIQFKSVFSDDTDAAIDDFIRVNPADLLVMAAHRRNAFERIFKKTPYLARFSATAYYPLLVFHY